MTQHWGGAGRDHPYKARRPQGLRWSFVVVAAAACAISESSRPAPPGDGARISQQGANPQHKARAPGRASRPPRDPGRGPRVPRKSPVPLAVLRGPQRLGQGWDPGRAGCAHRALASSPWAPANLSLSAAVPPYTVVYFPVRGRSLWQGGEAGARAAAHGPSRTRREPNPPHPSVV